MRPVWIDAYKQMKCTDNVDYKWQWWRNELRHVKLNVFAMNDSNKLSLVDTWTHATARHTDTHRQDEDGKVSKYSNKLFLFLFRSAFIWSVSKVLVDYCTCLTKGSVAELYAVLTFRQWTRIYANWKWLTENVRSVGSQNHFHPFYHPTKVIICACYVHSSKHKRKVITNDGRILLCIQIDDIAICEKFLMEQNLASKPEQKNERKTFSNAKSDLRWKKEERKAERWRKSDAILYSTMLKVQYDSGKVVIIHNRICAVSIRVSNIHLR